MTDAIDREKLQSFAKQVSGSVVGGLNCALTLVGDQLGLFKALADIGPASTQAIADHLDLSERWVREWLYQQSCIGQVSFDEATDEFYLTPEATAVLADHDHPAYLGSMFQSVVALTESIDELPNSFRTGLGQSYDDKGEACACGIERMSRQFQSKHLVPDLLPKLDTIIEKLQQGARVGDVGCGAATSTIAMARAFPNSEFFAYDISLHALERANANITESGLTNITLLNPEEQGLTEDESFDLITTFDVIHDSTHPDQLISAIRASLKPDGTWLCADIKGQPTFAENLKHNNMATLAYSFSVLVCMSASLSVPDGAGLGTLGFHEQKAREMTQELGFSNFRTIEYAGDVFNSFYEIRP